MKELGEKQWELINLLSNQVAQIEVALSSAEKVAEDLYIKLIDLTMISKIELGDDVIAEIKRLKEEIKTLKDG